MLTFTLSILLKYYYHKLHSLYLREKRGRLVKKNVYFFSFSPFPYLKLHVLKSTFAGLSRKTIDIFQKSSRDVEIYDFWSDFSTHSRVARRKLFSLFRNMLSAFKKGTSRHLGLSNEPMHAWKFWLRRVFMLRTNSTFCLIFEFWLFFGCSWAICLATDSSYKVAKRIVHQPYGGFVESSIPLWFNQFLKLCTSSQKHAKCFF